jgi:hypothetical protein
MMQWSFQNYIMLKSSRKKLIAIGCSFTEHYLSSTKTPDFDYNFPRWPQHLADKLDMECVNLGRCAMGNEYISAKLIDVILSEKKQDIGLVVLMWSGWQRLDFNYNPNRNILHDVKSGWVSLIPHKDNSSVEKYPMNREGRIVLLKYNNTVSVTMKSLRHFLIAQKLLEDIPYLMIQGVHPISGGGNPWNPLIIIDSPPKDIWMQTFLNSKIFDEIDEKKFIGWPIMHELGGYNVTDILNKLDPERTQLKISKEDKHPNAEGHKIIAQEIYNAYEKIYI